MTASTSHRAIPPSIVTDLPPVISPASMTPGGPFIPPPQYTPVSRPGSSSSVPIAAGRAPPVPFALQPMAASALPGSVSGSVAISPSRTSAPGPDLTQTFNDFAKRDAQWFAQHARPILDHHAQTKPTSASAVIPPRTQPSASNSAVSGTSVSAPINKKSKAKSMFQLSKGFLEDDVEWYKQQKAISAGPKMENADLQMQPITVSDNGQNQPTVKLEQLNEPIIEQGSNDEGISAHRPPAWISADIKDTEMTSETLATSIGKDSSEASLYQLSTAARNEMKIEQSTPEALPSFPPFRDILSGGGMASEDHVEGQVDITIVEGPPISPSPSPSPPPDRVAAPGHMQSSELLTNSAMPSKPLGEARQLDLSKMRTPSKTKTRRTSTDFVVAKVPPAQNMPSSTNNPSPLSPLTGSKSSLGAISDAQTPLETGLPTTPLPPLHVVQQSPADLDVTLGAPSCMAPPVIETSTASTRSTTPPVGTSASRVRDTSVSSFDDDDDNIQDTTSTISGSMSETVESEGISPCATEGKNPATAIDDPPTYSSTSENEIDTSMESPPPSTPKRKNMDEIESDDDEPLAAKRQRMGLPGDPNGPRRSRSRSASVPLLNQRRKTIPGDTASSPAPTMKQPQRLVSQPVHATPREYTAAAFESGSYVYSPVQANFVPSIVSTAPLTPTQLKGSPAQRRGVTKTTVKSSSGHSKISWQSTGLIVPTDAELARMPLFEDDSTVLGFHRGQAIEAEEPLSFEFELDDAVVEALTLWHTRHEHTK